MTVQVTIPGADLIHAMRRVTPAACTKADIYDFGVQLAVSAPYGEHTRRRTPRTHNCALPRAQYLPQP